MSVFWKENLMMVGINSIILRSLIIFYLFDHLLIPLFIFDWRAPAAFLLASALIAVFAP